MGAGLEEAINAGLESVTKVFSEEDKEFNRKIGRASCRERV